ncbi:hypothetical protein GQ457_15G022060 [Hibiscus cannabinus]
MCKAAKMSSVDGRALNADIGGCMVLLQSWAWYRLPFLAPICPAPSEFPLATRQFRFHQPVPEAPLNMDELEQIDTRGKTEKNWPLTHRRYVDLWNARATSRPRCDPVTTDEFDLSRSDYHQWLLQSGNLILTTQAEREAWLLLFPSSGHPRGSSGSSSSTVGASNSRRGSRGDGRGRRARRGVVEVEAEHEIGPQMEEFGVQLDTGSYPHRQGETSWEATIHTIVFQHGMPAHVWRGQQPWSHVEVTYENFNVPQFSVSEPQYYVLEPVDGGAGPSMFTTPRRMNVEGDSDDEDDDDDDGDDDDERPTAARVRRAPHRYDDTGSLHRQTLNRRRRCPQN